jgi:serine/threonine protein phosphatase PrpC
LGPQGEGFALEPDVVTVDLSDCRLLVISSDGFWNYAHPMQDQPPEPLNDLIAGLPQNAEALTVAETLVKFANESGGHDNITVAAIRL